MKIGKIISILLLIITMQFAYGQPKGYSSGYVINIDNKKIEGNIKDRGEASNCTRIKFIDNKGEKVKFKHKSVKSYYVNGKEYVMQPHQRPFGVFRSMYGYMRVIERGKVDLYEYSYIVQSGGSMGANGVMMGGGSYEKEDFYLKKSNGRVTLVKKMGFKNNLSVFFSDNKELSKRIKEKDLRYRDLNEIVRIYNGK